MVTSSGLTNRIDRLEGTGLVHRAANPTDRRGIRIELTDQGREVVDRVTAAYVEHQNQVLDAALQPDEREALARLLRKLLNSLTSDEGIEADQTPPAPRRRAPHPRQACARVRQRPT